MPTLLLMAGPLTAVAETAVRVLMTITRGIRRGRQLVQLGRRSPPNK